jgi:lipopolysaccharide/colanic/teichoic acid biosynthesis glycosyltransferase
VLIVSSPLIAAIALAIRLDSPGPIIFRQRRIGQHGREFTIYKFRTMFHDAPRGPEDGYVKRADDPRVTRVGHFLRRTSLDEVPQFFNVLIGDMSIVGPRPEMAQAAAYYTWGQQRRLEVPQGITGWWQTHGRSDRPLRDHIDDDLYYIRHYSFWLDLWIILRTIPSVLSLRGAY